MYILDYLFEHGFTVTEDDYYELDNVRVVEQWGWWTVYVFGGITHGQPGMTLEWYCDFSEGCPDSIIIGAVEAAMRAYQTVNT